MDALQRLLTAVQQKANQIQTWDRMVRCAANLLTPLLCMNIANNGAKQLRKAYLPNP